MLYKKIITAALSALAFNSLAGTITNGVWSPSNCGTDPLPPTIDQSSVENFNKSVKAINDWQQKANAYNSCLINEANADNALIAKTANDQQAKLRAAFEKIKQESEAAKTRLENQ